MGISATKLRQNLYQILDEVIESGISIEIERKGHTLKIIPDKKISKLDRLEDHDLINGNLEDVIMDWSGTWDKEKEI